MNRTYFKAVRADGTDFYTGKVRWLPDDGAPIPAGGWVVEHPTSERVGDDARTYLSVSTVETDCAGMGWPCRLLRVVPDGRQVSIPEPVGLPSTRASIRWRVIEELPAWQALGPQGREIEALLGQVESLTEDQTLEMSAARGFARGFARDVARFAALVASRGGALNAAQGGALGTALNAVRDAVLGWLVKDFISDEEFRTLVGPWEQVMGRVIA
ncbi:Hypothetical protein PFR_JS22-PH_2 [Propionibacterium freudenreichii]|uniref:hypothetical protein n=1 Tax=Propionibacterium freudenreichii TaxID=1744 RepID=UPI000541E41A|nr:hypothetical protein [Propionibacterium freudenreichii]CEH08706.1 Protein of unknown function [Propionibacterium freudenreichii]SBW77634.1 Hypothetical protein PFR_JS22-1_1986 [Propionibacterium freudenreichii]SCP02330.1 Hypothetical protein PFR_JS22-PH_2 [Propionibacterium freudenreichii]